MKFKKKPLCGNPNMIKRYFAIKTITNTKKILSKASKT